MEPPMLSSTMMRAPVRLTAMILQRRCRYRAQTGQANQIKAERETAKERLRRKASDEQRVDNCKVPPALRGPKPRPDECPDGASTRSHK
jgi:predicted TIM-barrel fold metal-dependent hydrolase